MSNINFNPSLYSSLFGPMDQSASFSVEMPWLRDKPKPGNKFWNEETKSGHGGLLVCRYNQGQMQKVMV